MSDEPPFDLGTGTAELTCQMCRDGMHARCRQREVDVWCECDGCAWALGNPPPAMWRHLHRHP